MFIFRVELTAVGRTSLADASVSEAVGIEMTAVEDDRSSTLDGTVSKDVVIADGVVKTAGILTTGSTDDSMVAEVGMALPTSLARLENVSVGAESRDSGTKVDSDVTVAS